MGFAPHKTNRERASLCSGTCHGPPVRGRNIGMSMMSISMWLITSTNVLGFNAMRSERLHQNYYLIQNHPIG
jgi:hypothetical protein